MSPASNNEPPAVDMIDGVSGDEPEVAVLCEDAVSGRRAASRLRRDVASGESLDAARLIRFVVSPEGGLVPDIAHKLPGRGLWVEASRQALEIAVKRNIFSKAAKRQIRTDAGLVDLVHNLLRRRCLDLLGLARREGGIVLGFEKVLATVSAGKAAWLIEASDGAEDGRKRILAVAARQASPPKLCAGFDNAELSLALGTENAIHAALINGRRVERWSAEMTRLSGFEPLAPSGWSRGAPP